MPRNLIQNIDIVFTLCPVRYQRLGAMFADVATSTPPPSFVHTSHRPLAEKTEFLLRNSSSGGSDGLIPSRVAEHLRRLLGMGKESLHIYLHPLENIRGVSTAGDDDSDGDDPAAENARVEHLDLTNVTGLAITRPLSRARLLESAKSGLLPPSGRPVMQRRRRCLSRPFVAFEKRYWRSALRLDQHRRRIDRLVGADILQVCSIYL